MPKPLNKIIMPLDQQESTVSEEAKTRAIIAHITPIGWIVAVVQNSNDKKEFASFYIRQLLGLILISIAGSILSTVIPFVGWIVHVGVLVIWILSLIGAINGKKELTPAIGEMFQDWFKGM